MNHAQANELCIRDQAKAGVALLPYVEDWIKRLDGQISEIEDEYDTRLRPAAWDDPSYPPEPVITDRDAIDKLWRLRCERNSLQETLEFAEEIVSDGGGGVSKLLRYDPAMDAYLSDGLCATAEALRSLPPPRSKTISVRNPGLQHIPSPWAQRLMREYADVMEQVWATKEPPRPKYRDFASMSMLDQGQHLATAEVIKAGEPEVPDLLGVWR